jgi:hypothetical protein
VRDQALRGDAGLLELLLQAEGEVEVGRLRLRVGAPRPVAALEVRIARVDGAAEEPGGAGDRDEPRPLGPEQGGQQVGCVPASP